MHQFGIQISRLMHQIGILQFGALEIPLLRRVILFYIASRSLDFPLYLIQILDKLINLALF